MAVIHVQPLSSVREHLSQVVARFRREGSAAEPVVFGTHRRPEAVLVPYEAYAEMQDWRRRLHNMLDAGRSVQVEVPGAFSAEHEQLVEAYVAGEISADE